MDPLSLNDFATVKTICAAIGLVVFMGVFITATVWVFRPGAKQTYANYGRKILDDEVKG